MSKSNFGFQGAVPPGVYVSDNIARALDYQRTHTSEETFNWFFDHVRNNRGERIMSKWESLDYKQINSDFADFGNFNYGAVAAALGISETVATCGAGWAQQQANGHGSIVSAALAGLDILGSCGDNPEDTIQIRAGHAIGATYSVGGTMVEDALLNSIRSSIIPGCDLELALVSAFLHNEVSAAGRLGSISSYSPSAGNYVQIERDNLGNVVEVANYVLNGSGWDIVVTDKMGAVTETYYQPISFGASDAGRESITFFSLGEQTSFLRGGEITDPLMIGTVVNSLFSASYLTGSPSVAVSVLKNGSVQSQNYVSSSSIMLPSGVQTSNGWYSFDVSTLNLAANTVVADLLGPGYGEKVGFQVSHLSTGNWNVGFTAVSGNYSSPMLERLNSVGTPHGVESFMRWFYARVEEWARDVNIVSSHPIGGEQLVATALDAEFGDAVEGEFQAYSPAGGDPVEIDSYIPELLSPFEPISANFDLKIELAASGLLESMAQWAPDRSGAVVPAHVSHRQSGLHIADLAVAI
jgi:hypothetical protein